MTTSPEPSQRKDLVLAFDIGHSSIGWAVLQCPAEGGWDPWRVAGAGTVLFPKDSCLASSRRAFRRTRRNIRARRERVARLKAHLLSLGVLSQAELDANPVSHPWLLAAKVLAGGGKTLLSWPELWAVLRWYAHNRGYDGNALWAGDDAPAPEGEDAPDKEDTEKVRHARDLMARHGTQTMAETVCAFLGLAPDGPKTASTKYFKGQKAAFPRDTVRSEVRRILEAHCGRLARLDDGLVRALVDEAPDASRRWKGGLLFGQKVPRFDNRLIPACRITGKNTPNKSSEAFLLYRWGRLLNNLTVREPATGRVRPLFPDERQRLHARMLESGYFTKTTLQKALREATGCEPCNAESHFMTEEMEEALVLDPVKKLLATNQILKAVWPRLGDTARREAEARLRAKKSIALADIFEGMEARGEDAAPARAALAEAAAGGKKGRGKKAAAAADPARKRLIAAYPSGRAAYCSPVLREAFAQCLQGIEPTAEGGVLHETPEIRQRLLREADNIDHLTNNHLLRHRLLVFRRLLAAIVSEFAGGDAKRIGRVAVEVVRDLQEFSGLDSQAMAKALNLKLGNFRVVSKLLEAEAARCGVPVTGSLIRKARLLADQQMTCPYTGKTIGFPDLFGGALEIEHIIPRSLRPSDALSSCVLTFRAVNEMKGQRTAAQFIRECGGQTVPGTDGRLSVLAWKPYEENVRKIFRPDFRYKPCEEDRKRCRRRAELMLVEHYDKRNADFTAGALAQTSHLNKLAIRLVKHDLGLDAVHVPGSVTGFLRPRLCLDECLVRAVPRLQQAARDADGKPVRLPKQEMRELTHLHHAMDAIAQGLACRVFDPADWEVLAQRHVPRAAQAPLRAKYPFVCFSPDGEMRLADLPEAFLASATDALQECRVVQHVPSRMHGIGLEQTTWRILDASDPAAVKLAQQTRKEDGTVERKEDSVKATRLLGGAGAPDGSKLKRIKGAIQIESNWGLALDPAPQIIPYFKVFPRLRALRAQNKGRPVRVLRNGNLIRVESGRYKGVWKVLSLKDNASGIALDLNAADKVKTENKSADTKINVSVKSLLESGLTILAPTLTGQCPTTSSR